MKKTKIYLVRHGETEFNRLGVFRGRYEVELNQRGIKQAEEISRALASAGIQKIYTSPLKRALKTAEIISRNLGIDYVVNEAFNNIDLGSWQGVKKEEIKKRFPDLWKLWITEPEKLTIPDGETLEDVKKRAFNGIMEVLSTPIERVAIVTHRSVIKVLAAAMLNVQAPYFWKFYIDNAAYSVFEHDGAQFILLEWNNNSHLSEKVKEVF